MIDNNPSKPSILDVKYLLLVELCPSFENSNNTSLFAMLHVSEFHVCFMQGIKMWLLIF